jgi:hypothetical protein
MSMSANTWGSGKCIDRVDGTRGGGRMEGKGTPSRVLGTHRLGGSGLDLRRRGGSVLLDSTVGVGTGTAKVHARHCTALGVRWGALEVWVLRVCAGRTIEYLRHAFMTIERDVATVDPGAHEVGVKVGGIVMTVFG